MKNLINFRNEFGFTLIELLVVIGIIGILTAISTIAYSSVTKNSRDQRRKVDIEQVRSALEMYRSNQVNANYPTNSQYFSGNATTYTSVLEPNYIAKLPSDPGSKLVTTYIYAAIPSGCNNNLTPPPATVFCTSYLLTVPNMEMNGLDYVIGPTYTDGVYE